MTTLSKEQIQALGMRLRKPDGSPAIPRPAELLPPPKNDVAEALEMVAEAMREMQTAIAKPDPNLDVMATSIVRLLKQNAELLKCVQEMLKPEPIEVKEEEVIPMEWDFTIIRDPRTGFIKSVKAKECK